MCSCCVPYTSNIWIYQLMLYRLHDILFFFFQFFCYKFSLKFWRIDLWILKDVFLAPQHQHNCILFILFLLLYVDVRYYSGKRAYLIQSLFYYSDGKTIHILTFTQCLAQRYMCVCRKYFNKTSLLKCDDKIKSFTKSDFIRVASSSRE